MNGDRLDQNTTIMGNLVVDGYVGAVSIQPISMSFENVPVLFPNNAQFKKDVHVENSLKIGDMDVKKIIEHQANEINHLKRKLEELYYAPGMPGYIRAAQTFEENKKRKIEY